MDDDVSDDVSRCTEARGAREARESISSELWSARERAHGDSDPADFSPVM